MTTTFNVTATPEDAGERLDRFLARALPDLSRARLQSLIKDGACHHDGATIREARHRVKPDEHYEISIPEAVAAAPLAEAIALNVVHEDAALIVIDKPAGLVVHPAAGHWSGTLVNALIAHCGDSLSGIGGVRRPGIVHRLDKDTTGLMVVAKTDAAHRSLTDQFAAHGLDGRLERGYVAFAWGRFERPAGRIDAPLGRATGNRTKISVQRTGGRHAVTHYVVEERVSSGSSGIEVSRVACRLETGRTHQIRVHLAHIGHPLLGDTVYGSGFAASARRLDEPARSALTRLGRQALHAASLGFEHPVSGRRLSFTSPLPDDLAQLETALGGDGNRPLARS